MLAEQKRRLAQLGGGGGGSVLLSTVKSVLLSPQRRVEWKRRQQRLINYKETKILNVVFTGV